MMNEKNNNDSAVVYERPRNETIAFRDRKLRRSTKKGKITAAAHDITSVGSHFTFQVQSSLPIVVADNISLYVVMKNHGPAMIEFSTRPHLIQKLVPGGLWAMPVVGDLAVGSRNGEPALVEIEFLPKLK